VVMLENDSITPDPDPASIPVGPYWTPTRLDLQAWLQRNAPSLAELYEGSVKLIYDVPIPGWVCFVSHAVREIGNRLPEIVSGIKNQSRLDYKTRMDDIARDWEKAGLGVDGSSSGSVFSRESATDMPSDREVPQPLWGLITAIVRDHVKTRETTLEAATRLFEGRAPENQKLRDALRPAVLQWLQVKNWFMERAHNSGKVDASYDKDELRRQFELFESSLGALVRGFFSTVKELDEILEDTNS